MCSQVRIEELLAQSRWIRELAFQLVRDEGLADDVAQEAWVSALRHPPEGVRSLRGWLRRVVRNVVLQEHRGSARRRRREERAARPEALPSTSDLVEQADLQKNLVQEVLALPEPYRAVVLRRYFRDESAEQIAEEEGVPSSTIRNRLRRALRLLKERLERRDPSSWRDRCLAVAATSTETIASNLAKGAGAMLSGKKLAAAASVLVLAGVVLLDSSEPEVEALGGGEGNIPRITVSGEMASARRLVEGAGEPEAEAMTANQIEQASGGPPAHWAGEDHLYRIVARERASKEVIAGLRLRIVPWDPETDWRGEPMQAATDGQGLCEVRAPGGLLITSEDDHWVVDRFGGGRVNPVAYTEESDRRGFRWRRILCRPAGRLAGRVVSEEGEPLEDVPIFARMGEHDRDAPDWIQSRNVHEDQQVARTDSRGRFVLEKLPSGLEVQFRVELSGRVPMRFEGAIVPERQTIDLPAFVLTRGVWAEWEILDGAGKPLSGAEVSMSDPRGSLSEQLFDSAYAMTTSIGRCKVGPLPARELTAYLRAQGHRSQRVSWRPADGFKTVRLSPLGTIAGRALRPDGQPVSGLHVTAEGYEYEARTTGEDGRFRLRLPAGTHDLLVSNLRLATDVDTGTLDLEIVVGVGAVYGRVVRPSEWGDSVDVVLETEKGELVRHTRAHDEFRFETVLGGSYLVSTDYGRFLGFEDDSERIVITDGGEVGPIVLEPRRSCWLNGIVRSKSHPVLPKAWVMAEGPDGAERRFQGETGGDGAFFLWLPRAGTYTLRAECPGFDPWEEDVEVLAGRNRHLIEMTSQSAATVRGRVHRAGYPLDAATVWLPPFRTRTDADGRFVLEHVPPGTGLLRIENGRKLLHERVLALRPNQEHQVDVDVAGGVRIEGQVLFQDAPHAFASVFVDSLRNGRRTRVIHDHRTSVAGRFTFEGLWPGSYVIEVLPRRSYQSLAPAVSTARVDCPRAGTFSIDLAMDAASLEVRVIDEQGTPIPEGMAWLHSLESHTPFDVKAEVVDGLAFFEGVPVGDAELEVFGGLGQASYHKKIALGAGENRGVVEVRPAGMVEIETAAVALDMTGRARSFATGRTQSLPHIDRLVEGKWELLVGRRPLGARYAGVVDVNADRTAQVVVDLAPLARLTLIVLGAEDLPAVSILGPHGFDHEPFGHYPHYRLEPGTYRVAVWHGALEASADVHMTSASQELLLELN